MSFGQRVLDAQGGVSGAVDAHGDGLDGHCCAGCKADADRARRAGRNPMLRVVHRVPSRAMGQAAPKSSGAMMSPAVGMDPGMPMGPPAMGQSPMLAHRGYPDAGRYARVDPATFVYVMGGTPQGWCQLDPASKIANVQAFEAENPGAIGDTMAFVRGMDSHCTGVLIIGRSNGLRASGDITWAPAGTTQAGVATDADSNTVSLDANGDPISGTVVASSDGGGGALGDSQWTGAGAYSVYGVDYSGGGSSSSSGGGGASPAPVAAADSPAQLAATRALWTDVGSLITSAGTDIAALINAGNQQALAQINASLALALHSNMSPTTGAQLNAAQIAQMQQLQALIAPKPALSTTAKVGIGVGVLAAGAWALGLI